MQIFIGIGAGVLAGLMGALCGVGGGIVMVPIFTSLLNMGQKQAVATSLAVIFFTSIAATVNNARTSDLIDWKIVIPAAIGAVVAAWFGSDLMRSMSNETLVKVFGVILVGFGVKMLFFSNS